MRATVLGMLWMVACGGGPDAAASGDEAAPVEADEAVAADQEAPSDERPRTREVTPTGDEALGTLPEGIGVPVGEPAPDASVEQVGVGEVSLADLYAEGPVLVVFYRGGWCPYCNYQIRELSMAWPKFSERGVDIVAISVDRPDEATRTAQSWEIPFYVAADPDVTAHRAWRMEQKIDADAVEGLGMDVEAASGRDHHTIAVPGMFYVVDGTVRWAHADADYKVRPSPAQVLAALDQVDP